MIYIVVGFSYYYPSVDNSISGYFTSYKKAKDFLEKIKEEQNCGEYDILRYSRDKTDENMD